MNKKPIIGMTAFYGTNAIGSSTMAVRAPYVDEILLAGGVPYIIPGQQDMSIIDTIAEVIDGYLVPGGADVAPYFYGEETIPQVTLFKSIEDSFEMELIKKVHAMGKPIFGICRGLQVINVAFGGSLIQDIPAQLASSVGHLQAGIIRDEATHGVTLTAESRLAAILGTVTVPVNSYHHQAIKQIAPNFTVTGTAADGVVEAAESNDGLVLGVQWHPELMARRHTHFQKLFSHFVSICANKGKF